MNSDKLIYAVDDEESIREVYRFALSGAGFEPRCFSCWEELSAALKSELPRLIILDIMLDGADGYEILKKLRDNANTADIPVIMVSAKNTEIDKVKGLNLGADDYLAKPFGVLELVARINAKLRSAKTRPVVYEYKDIVIDDNTHTVTVGGKNEKLTLKQYELLKLLVINAQKVMRRDELLDAVWGVDYGETRTLDIHIGDLRKILSASAAELSTIRGVGYLLK
ncbi:MAG: response regulator [Clostridia bacterium]|nr:response regulator [Clostridia bacterium]MDY2714592.1 response regulator [Christensenellaceae bacterium]